MKRATFGERLKFAQEHSGLTLQQLAKRTRVDAQLLESMIALQATTVTGLTLTNLALLCELLGCSWAWLVEGTPTKHGIAAALRIRLTTATWQSLSEEEREHCCDILEMLA